MAPTASHNFAIPVASGTPAQDNQLVSKFAPSVNSQANHKNLLTGGLARGVVFGLLALAVTPFILTTPVHATDDNTVSIAVDQNATLQPTGALYKATTNVKVTTGKPYGFNLTMQADTTDLLNSKDQAHKISATPSSTPVALNANQWGYSLNKSATTFSAVPAGAQATPAVVADVTKAKPAGCANPANCTKQVTFAANVDPAKLASGSYSTSITYTATAKPAPKPVDWPQRTAKTNPSETCQAGNTNSSCLVTLDRNMIPVKYTGTTTNAQWTSVADPEAANSGWYDYANKQWANAITVKPEALSKYRGFSKVVDQADILGFWVYIPRYRYKVLRFSGSDPAVPAQNFTIEFENKQSTKATPTANGTWATHPAFTFGTKELNGIWFAKFETTGTTSQPTVLPNEAHISGYYSGMNNQVGNFYSLSKTLGINDPNNVGGSGFTTTQNNHHLAKLSSHMVNNNDWGAATYLSASKYGAGYNGVKLNAQNQTRSTSDGTSYGTTGCGPQSADNLSYYGDGIGGALGTQHACTDSDIQRAYNGTLGQLASTTNNPTGIYDMSGGGWEYTASSYTSDLNNSSTSYFSQSAHPPYVNTYNFSNPNSCTFATCGGQALYETNDGNNNTTAQWNGNWMHFVESSYLWFVRGGYCLSGSSAGLFYALSDNSGAGLGNTFRVALAPLQD